ncbi:MAG: DNA-3-methyladenine glycosylase 2 family protein [Azoarcus sp.]|jgi:DNA-3-methyladenine glycosylase II|nr:DNA-3-methyladenine glycosylase 2 family protein [Azoarcus sp.]
MKNTKNISRLTPENMAMAEEHLSRSCPVMATLITTHGHCRLAGQEEYNPFRSLVRAVISQQLSTKAARTISGRVESVMPSLTPEGLLAVSADDLRTAGLSAAKVRCVRELASRSADGRLNFNAFPSLSEDAVIAALTQVPGIGRWTAEMFLIFGLLKPDVLAVGDGGLQRAARQLFGENVNLDKTGQIWRPWRSVASWYLWRHLDNAPPT